MSVDFTNRPVDILLLLSSDTVTSRNEICDLENSCVNLMVLCNEFMWLIKSSSLPSPRVQTIKMSSMYLHHRYGFSGNCARSFSSRSPIKRLA